MDSALGTVSARSQSDLYSGSVETSAWIVKIINEAVQRGTWLSMIWRLQRIRSLGGDHLPVGSVIIAPLASVR